MASVLDRAKAHYESLPVRSLDVPEWGEGEGKPLKVTWKPLTVRDREKIYAYADGQAPTGGLVSARAVIIKACDEQGKRLFDGMADHDLRHSVDGDVVARIASAILYGAGLQGKDGASVSVDDQTDAAKNG